MRELWTGEVRQDTEWIPMDWAFSKEAAIKKTRARIKRLLGPIRLQAPGDTWFGRVVKWVPTESEEI